MPLFKIHFYRPSRSLALAVSLVSLGVFLGCRGPELRISSNEIITEPLFLMVQLPEGPDRESRENILRENLNETLKTRHSLVMPEDRKERDPILLIQVQELSRGEVTKQTVSSNVATGASLGAISGLAAGAETTPVLKSESPSLKEARDSLAFVVVTTVAGATVGTVAGTVGGVSDGVARSAYHDLRLGYRPKHLLCTVSYAPDGTTTPHQIGSTDAWAVLKEMRPMSNDDAHNIQKLHKEEARALAAVVERILKQAVPQS